MKDVHSTYKVHYGSYVFPLGSKKVKIKLSFMLNKQSVRLGCCHFFTGPLFKRYFICKMD